MKIKRDYFNMLKTYNKLIRDKILEIIENAGEKPYWRILNKKEYRKELRKKVLEEAREVIDADNKKDLLNELTDIQELIDALLIEYDITKTEIKESQKLKNKKRGAFKKKLFLIKTEK